MIHRQRAIHIHSTDIVVLLSIVPVALGSLKFLPRNDLAVANKVTRQVLRRFQS
jgi:hypothetical protein